MFEVLSEQFFEQKSLQVPSESRPPLGRLVCAEPRWPLRLSCVLRVLLRAQRSAGKCAVFTLFPHR